MKRDKPVPKASKEIGESIVDAANLAAGVNDALEEVSRLRDHGYGGAGDSLISLGLAMVLFPEPTFISDVAGAGVMAAGVLYNRVVPPPLYMDDLTETISEQVKAMKEVAETPGPIDVLSKHLVKNDRKDL